MVDDGARDSIPIDADVVGCAVLLVAATAITATPLFDGSVVAVAAAGTVLLFLPGYALTAALSPRRDEPPLLERLVYAVGVSAAIGILLGVALARTPVGLTATTVTAGAYLVTLPALGVAAARRRRLSVDDRAMPASEALTAIRDRLDAVEPDGATWAVAVAALALVAAAAYAATTPVPGERFTELYVVPGSDGAGPVIDAVGDGDRLTVVVANHEHERARYRLRIRALNGTVVLDERTVANLTLAMDREWRRNRSASIPAGATRYDLVLDRLDVEDGTTYRRVSLPVTESGGDADGTAATTDGGDAATER